METGTRRCECEIRNFHRRIVLTGGPGAGKTAVLEALKHSLCSHVAVLPEAAGIVFGGGFPRLDTIAARRAAQRAIFHVQRELETVADDGGATVVLCDRGLLDAIAYWPGPQDFWAEVGMTREAALARYDVVIHLRVPDGDHGYGNMNPLRVESAEQAAAIDERILDAWAQHPHRYVVDAADDFVAKVGRVLALVREELPACCRRHTRDALAAVAPVATPRSARAASRSPRPYDA
ncbi:MAG TPA: ATP-binding protein [Gemmatimonadaceae bacterium]|nr:ATP-binding protein [Gemmatimonadaceae bacterium]